MRLTFKEVSALFALWDASEVMPIGQRFAARKRIVAHGEVDEEVVGRLCLEGLAVPVDVADRAYAVTRFGILRLMDPAYAMVREVHDG